MSESSCPCGSGLEFDQCCEPYILGEKVAPTPEALMRSRYSAYVVGDVGHIEKSHDPATRHEVKLDEVKEWSGNATWHGLDILETWGGKENDVQGKVEFVATYSFQGEEQIHHELSDFKKIDGQWYFVDGQQLNQTYRRGGPKVGRNDPCPCGSKKKFKKCCGA